MITRRLSGLPLLVLALAVGALDGGMTSAAQDSPKGLVNARVETRSAATGLEPAVRAVLAGKTTAWIAYRVPILRRSAGTISSTGSCCGRCRLEPPVELTVLARVETGAVVALKTMAVDCDVDAGGVPIIWLNDVKPDESVGWLASLAAQSSSSANRLAPLAASALSAIGQHDAGAAVPTLVTMARQGGNRPLQRQAIFWLGRSNDPLALKFFEETLLK